MIICPNCAKENQDHYKFCLGCGAKLDVEAGTPMPVHPPPVEPSQPAASHAAGPPSRVCSSCGFPNPAAFKFCGRCGAALDTPVQPAGPPIEPTRPAAPTAPAPVATASPPQRAAVPNAVQPAAAPQPATAPSHPQAADPTNRHVPVGIEMGSAQTIFAGEEHADEAEANRPSARASERSGATIKTDDQPSAHAREPAAGGPAAKLIMLGPDGQPIGERVLGANEALGIGRDAGPPWQDDAYLDPKHATLQTIEDGVHVEDHGSLNGIYVKLANKVEIQSGDQFRGRARTASV